MNERIIDKILVGQGSVGRSRMGAMKWSARKDESDLSAIRTIGDATRYLTEEMLVHNGLMSSRGVYDRPDLVLGRQLSQAEVDALPEGTEVYVTWCGGNGPHKYFIARRGKQTHAVMKYEQPLDYERLGDAGHLDSVGPLQANNRVWLPATSESES